MSASIFQEKISEKNSDNFSQVKLSLHNFLPEEIAKEFSLEKKFIAEQIFSWLSKGVKNFSEMTNVSKELQKKLSDRAEIFSSKVIGKFVDADKTAKLQIQTNDGNIVEAVLLVDKMERKTACVSSQAGCAMACAFCKTGTLNLARNLTTAEIVEQFLFLENEFGKLSNIVFMGMGEPLANFSNVQKAIRILTHEKGRALSLRRIVISTVGLVPMIERLTEEGPFVRLALSLVTADEKTREKLLPQAKTNSLKDLERALFAYQKKSGRRISLEAVLLSGVNTNEMHANKMIDFAKRLSAHINLIPWNKVSGLPFTSPSETEIRAFQSILENAHCNVTVRMHRGENILGACGQLGKTKNVK